MENLQQEKYKRFQDLFSPGTPTTPPVLLTQRQEYSTTRKLEDAKNSTPWDKEDAKNTDYCGQGQDRGFAQINER